MRAYRVAYDGRAYHGFQRQPDVPTVEDALCSGLRELGLEFEGTPPGYAAAGRTDRGVSALAQTVAFDAPEWLTPRAFTTHLPEDVHVWASASVPEDFHATHDAISREYTYFLHASDGFRDPDGESVSGLGHGAVGEAAPEPGREMGDLPAPDRIGELESRLSGEHDFHNLSAAEAGTVRDLSVTSSRAGEYRVIEVRAAGFPRQLVRRLVSLYDRVRRGEDSLAFVDRVLSPEPLPGPEGIEPAPAHPLVLTEVAYGVDFEPDPTAAALAHEALSAQARRDRTRATALDSIDGRLEFGPDDRAEGSTSEIGGRPDNP
ncbi:MAG: tRNA pseudouridine(38-40) synthase TruA [Halodesulfurarchaeum sp.]